MTEKGEPMPLREQCRLSDVAVAAPQAEVPACKEGCGTTGLTSVHVWWSGGRPLGYCTPACHKAGRPQNPAPEGQHVPTGYRLAPAPASEPSAPPAGVPMCKAKCGGRECWEGCFGRHGEMHLCSDACADAGRALNPPPSDPVLTDEEAEAAITHDFRPGAYAGVVPPSDPVTVATGGVPSDEAMCNRRTCMHRITQHTTGGCTRGCGCPEFVPIDAARSVPPGPVPVEAWRGVCVCNTGDPVFHAHYSDGKHSCARCSSCDAFTAAAPPAAPASEPAVRPLSERMIAWVTPERVPSLLRRQELQSFFGLVAALEAELADAKRIAGNRMDLLTAVRRQRNTASDQRDAARAEVDQLRGKLVEAEERAVHNHRAASSWAREATVRVHGMREFVVKAIDDGLAYGLFPVGTEKIIADRIRRLPLDTGTATDAGGEAGK